MSKAATPAPTPAPAPRRMDLRNLGVRVATALVFGAFFSVLLYLSDAPLAKVIYLALMGLATFMGIREMVFIARKQGYKPSLAAATFGAWLLLLHFFLDGCAAVPGLPAWVSAIASQNLLPLWAVLGLTAFAIHFGALFSKDNLDHALPSQAITWLAVMYMGLGLGIQQRLFMYSGTTVDRTGGRLILALLVITWMGDTTAYFVGSLLGRHKLAPRVSPKKTWEGALGNLAGNLGGAFLVKFTALKEWSVLDAIALGLLMGVAGQLGDLVESTWKRSAGVKDSNVGAGIPGHGGMLDRVDSLIFAAPVLYFYVRYIIGLTI